MSRSPLPCGSEGQQGRGRGRAPPPCRTPAHAGRTLSWPHLTYLVDLSIIRGLVVVVHLVHVLHILVIFRVLLTVLVIFIVLLLLLVVVL